MIKDKRVAIVFRSICFLTILAGLMLHMNVFGEGLFIWRLMYYTIQSNILALFMFGLLLVKTIIAYVREGKHGETGFFARFEMVCVIDLLLTMLVYWVLLAPVAPGLGDEFALFTFANISVHLLAPLFCLMDYIIFPESGHIKYRDVYAILIFPFLYIAFTSAAGFMGYIYRLSVDGTPVRFPYFFMDYDEVGLKAFLYMGILVFIFLLITHGFYLLDKKWIKPIFLGQIVNK
jgi:uncharacterized membrane protein YhdT